MSDARRVSGGHNEIELDGSEDQAAPLELDLSVDRATAAQDDQVGVVSAGTDQHDIDVAQAGADQGPTPELARHPNLGAERAARREAQLERTLAAKQATYVPPATAREISSELNIARAIPLVLIVTLVLAIGYWFCRHQVADKLHQFWMSAADLRDRVMATRKVPTVEDVRNVVAAQAAEADVALERDRIEIIVEPIATSRHFNKLGENDQMQASVNGAEWIVGYRTEASAKYGVASQSAQFEHFFYLHDFQPPAGVVSEPDPAPVHRRDW